MFPGLVPSKDSLSVLPSASTVGGEEEEGTRATTIVSLTIDRAEKDFCCCGVFASVIGMGVSDLEVACRTLRATSWGK